MQDWQQGDISSNGIRIHYYRTGGVDKPPLILAHGFTDNGLCWTRTAEALMSGFDVVMVDARNHGLSGAGPADVGSLAADLAALVAQLELGVVSALGHSVGASVVATFAADYPDLVARLVLEDPPWRQPSAVAEAKPNNPKVAKAQSPRDTAFRELVATMAQFSDAEMLHHGRSQHPSWPEAEYIPWGQSNRQVSADAMALLELGDWPAVAKGVLCPSLLICADTSRDAIVSHDTAAWIQQLNPMFSTRQVSDAGHNVRRENFAGYISLVREFLTSA